MIRIALVGDIGSGKSYIAKYFGYPVFNADFEVRKLYKNDRKIFNKLNKVLPKYIYVKRYTPKLKSGIKKEYKGVSVEHPKGNKTFGKTSKYSFNELLEQAKEYLQHLESLP